MVVVDHVMSAASVHREEPDVLGTQEDVLGVGQQLPVFRQVGAVTAKLLIQEGGVVLNPCRGSTIE